MLDKKLIPAGPYCYGTKICPYWQKIAGRPYQADGYCNFINKGDLEIEQEGCGISLLWDQCKECGINEEWDGDIE